MDQLPPTNLTQLLVVKHLHQSILPNDNTKQTKNATLKLIFKLLKLQKETETND